MTPDPRLAQIKKLNAEYREITGSDFYLYTSRPGDGQTRVTFVDGVKQGYGAGLDHMYTALAEARQRQSG